MVTLHSVGRMAQKLLKRSLSYCWKSYQFRGFTSSDSLLLSRFTVFRMVEASAKREWLVMNRKGPWEGYRRQAKPVVSFPPSFARIFSSRERDVWVRGSFFRAVLLTWENTRSSIIYVDFKRAYAKAWWDTTVTSGLLLMMLLKKEKE